MSSIFDFALVGGFWSLVLLAICPIAYVLEKYLPDWTEGDDD